MKTKLIALLALICVGVSSCYDDSMLRDQLADYNEQLADYGERLAALETLCGQMNTNISSLQTLVEALQQNDYITSVAPITVAGSEVGFVINFAKSSPITIYHGQAGKDGADGADGQDGHTPVIGVKKDALGVYYWTIDGEWLLDAKGNKVKAVGTDGKDGADGKDGKDGQDGLNGSSSSNGTPGAPGKDGEDGKDGITPQLKIEDDYWWVSYDNGETWQKLYSAVNNNGSTSGGNTNVYTDSIFKKVTIEDGVVNFELLDGEMFSIPRLTKVDIILSVQNEVTVSAGETIYISYELENASEGTFVTAASDGYYKVRVRQNGTSGVIEVDCPKPYVDGFINITATDGNGYSYVKCLSFCERQMSLYNGYEYNVNAQGGEVNIPFDINFDYTVSTNESWISVVDTKAEMRDGYIKLNVAKNSNMSARRGTINVYAQNNTESPYCQIYINQASAVFSAEKTNFIAAASGETFTTSIVSTNGLSFNPEELPSWIEVTTEGNSSSYDLTIKVSQNSDDQMRSAEISCYDETMSTVLGKIMVVQRPYLSDDASAMIFRVRANFANDFTCSVPITDYYYDYYYHYPDCIIDWGDGTVDHVTSENYGTARTHTYEGLTQGQDFEVKITGYVPALYGGGADSGVTHVLQWGNTGLRSMSRAFSGNSRLESIPADNTGAFAEVTDFWYCFSGCSSLTYLPEGLFANCPNVTSFGYCFSGCSSLTEVPEGLFANNRNVTDFGSCFSGCSSLTYLPEGLFANCPNVYDDYDEGGFVGCFSGCSSLTYLPEGLFANCPNVTSFYACFYNCSSLTDLPEGLFANNPNVTSFGYCFSGCSSLTDLPEGLFANNPNVTSFGSCFYGCSSLTDLPEGLFANNPNVISFRFCFYECDGLTEVPVSLFDNNRMVLDFSYTFYGCYLSGESPYTEIDGVKYHLYERCNAPDYFKTPTSYGHCFNNCYNLTDWDSIPNNWYYY